MATLNRLMATFVLTAACGIGWSTASLAQSGPPQSAPPPSSAGAPGPGGPPPGEPDQQQQGEEAQPQQIPILAVTSVEVLRGSQTPTSDIIRVRGISSTQGWDNPELFPITQGTPSDGILDLVLVATPPNEHEPSGFGQVEAILPVDPGHPYKGVRVRSANNAVTLKTFPGAAQGKGPSEDCSKCVGKHFVAKGGTAPAGVAAGDTVKQDDLPANVRIVRPGDGISDLQSNPNRLTLVIGEDGKIIDAAWD